MGLDRVADGWNFGDGEHTTYYGTSSFYPPAPEYSVGEVLVGAAYRGLHLGIHENRVQLDAAAELPERLSAEGKLSEEEWTAVLLEVAGGLGSPPYRRQPEKLKPISPYVPEIARYSCVLGKSGRRWNPSNLLSSALYSGAPEGSVGKHLDGLKRGLRVDKSDDLLARFVEAELQHLHEPEGSKEEFGVWPPANRTTPTNCLTPAERFVRDLQSLVALKNTQTRKQWVVLLEALLRVGLPLHYLWMCRLNHRVWQLAVDLLSGQLGEVPDVGKLEITCWEGHQADEPLLELGADSRPFVEKWIRRYLVARIGISVILHSCESAGIDVPEDILRADIEGDSTVAASERLFLFLSLIADRRDDLNLSVSKETEFSSVSEMATRLADSIPDYINCDTGPGDNAKEFLRYTMGQLRPREDELRAYDQAYLTFKRGESGNSPWIVSPGPAMLLLMVHSACRDKELQHQSVHTFKEYLGSYGLETPSGELSSGSTGKKLEQLGIAVDSPDAGGGRLLYDPL